VAQLRAEKAAKEAEVVNLSERLMEIDEEIAASQKRQDELIDTGAAVESEEGRVEYQKLDEKLVLLKAEKEQKTSAHAAAQAELAEFDPKIAEAEAAAAEAEAQASAQPKGPATKNPNPTDGEGEGEAMDPVADAPVDASGEGEGEMPGAIPDKAGIGGEGGIDRNEDYSFQDTYKEMINRVRSQLEPYRESPGNPSDGEK
jgi:hypothetical protein